MVFFSSCASVKYHAELLNFIDMEVKDIHGKQKQQRRTTTFMEFCKVWMAGNRLLCAFLCAPHGQWVLGHVIWEEMKVEHHREQAICH
jgi:hypothetical protein